MSYSYGFFLFYSILSTIVITRTNRISRKKLTFADRKRHKQTLSQYIEWNLKKSIGILL